MTSKDDKVGYGRPPVHTRFKPGQSGNPKGRPRGSLNFVTDLERTLQAPVRVIDSGKSRTVSSQHGLLLRLKERAFKGEPRALDKYVSLAATFFAKTEEPASKPLSADDLAILERYRQEVLTEAKASPQGKTEDQDNP
ncbi:hypothetical protein E4K64_27925 [Bradyrhizobium frederickii]|uniref:DUF5681 domain-containing protein n=1 Tax=Bradyrhizobium frederickii TaxID=2560054 RepID=A0A4Y9NTJ1_9BRAD|nr:DUF5681 domain-containing protein [Bradyrhizobium frederickii]TFV71241.1 hypothetical protein E4K64_27925 [Bradyrhizobium frederickii]